MNRVIATWTVILLAGQAVAQDGLAEKDTIPSKVLDSVFITSLLKEVGYQYVVAHFTNV